MLFYLVACLIGLIGYVLWYLNERNNLFEKLAIPGPKPVLLFGNLLTYRKSMPHEAFQRWTKEFGKVFGYYEGGKPVLVTSDLEILQEIFIKQFSNFNARKKFPIQGDRDKDADIDMFSASGIRWKRIRTIVNPTFTTMKLKSMGPIMNDAVNIFMEKMSVMAKDGTSFNIYSHYQQLTMDVIARCAFGWVSNCQLDPKDEFLVQCAEVMNRTVPANQPWFVIAAVLLPELQRFLYLYAKRSGKSEVRDEPFEKLMNSIRAILAKYKAKKSTGDTNNLLQLLLSAESDNSDWAHDALATDVSLKDVGKIRLDKKLLNEEVAKQVMLFLIAGFETTSTALAYCTHLLTTNPDCLDKLIEEIDTNLPNKSEEPTLEQVQSLQYLDMVVHEVLRMYPIAASVEARECVQRSEIKGYMIPEGLCVAADVWSIHYDPNYWEDPYQFNPERFSPEAEKTRNPMTWIPFGAGPRTCIGVRFAYMEVKIALVRILRLYRFKEAPETEIPLKLKEGATVTPLNGVTIKIVRR